MKQLQAGNTSGNLVHSPEEHNNSRQKEQSKISMAKLSGEILLAEDNLLNQQLVQRLLEKMGATVTVAENGAVAVNLAQQNHYDLIYMDMQMPVVSGIDAVRTLRNNDYTCPIVMLTANTTLEDRALCKDAGSDGFLAKPIDTEKLYEVTEKYLKPFR
jgi:CheY-like chemotaxis protein